MKKNRRLRLFSLLDPKKLFFLRLPTSSSVLALTLLPSKIQEIQNFDRYVEAEKTNGRWAMIGVAGILGQEILGVEPKWFLAGQKDYGEEKRNIFFFLFGVFSIATFLPALFFSFCRFFPSFLSSFSTLCAPRILLLLLLLLLMAREGKKETQQRQWGKKSTLYNL